MILNPRGGLWHLSCKPQEKAALATGLDAGTELPAGLSGKSRDLQNKIFTEFERSGAYVLKIKHLGNSGAAYRARSWRKQLRKSRTSGAEAPGLRGL